MDSSTSNGSGFALVVIVAVLAIALIAFVAIAALQGSGDNQEPTPGSPLPTILPSIVPRASDQGLVGAVNAKGWGGALEKSGAWQAWT